MTDKNNTAQPVLTDDQIEAFAKKHIAPHADRLDAIMANPVPYQQTEQFRRVKALIIDVLSKLRAPVADTYVEARECGACGHVGINDSSDTLAACKNCDWSGDSPKEDHCPGCAQVGTMTAACPKCGSQYSLLADRTISAALASAPVAGEEVGEIVLFGGELKEVSWRHGKMPPPGTKLYAAPQASEAATDRFRTAYMEWQDKTDFIQKRIASGELPVKYLGWHRADVMRDLIEQAGNDARYEALEREHLGDADKGTGIYHPDNQPAGDGFAAKRARIEADMARGSRLTSHRLRLDEQHPRERPPADLATMLLWLKRRMTWGMVSIPGAEVARLVAEIEALQRSQHDIDARARQLVADAAASGQVVRIDLVPRQPLAMGNLDMCVDVRPARRAPAPD